MFKKGKMLSIILAITLLFQCTGLVAWPIPVEAAGATKTPFDYAIFSNNSITLNGGGTIEGSVHANGSFTSNGQLTISGSCEARNFTINGNENKIKIGNKDQNAGTIAINQIPANIQSQLAGMTITHNSDKTFESGVINLDNSIYVNGNVIFNSASFTGKGIIRATGNITFHGSTSFNSNGSEICLYSENGNIIINGNTKSGIVGSIYAPKGTFTKNGGADLSVEGRIIANEVMINGKLTSFFADGASNAVPGSGTIRILEIQPGLACDIDKTMISNLQSYFGRTVEITQMSMPLFISKVDEINGYYDIVYIGNNKTSGDNYSRLGAKVTNKPNYAAGVWNDVEYYSGNDITNLAASKIKSFIDSKQLIVFDAGIFNDSTLLSSKLVTNFSGYLTNPSGYPNVKSDTKENLLFSLRTYQNTNILKKPTLNVKQSPLQYNGRNAIANGGLMGFTVDLSNNNSSNPVTVKLYLDMNGDGIYQDTEVVSQYNNVRKTEGYTINYSLPVNYSGLAPWKLEVTDEYDVKAYQTGFSAYKGSELKIRVLQLLPANNDGSATFKLSSLRAINNENMLVKSGEYNIEVTEMKINDFNNNYGSLINNKPTVLNGNYDMVVVGFDDSFVGDLDNRKGALNALIAFADSGQSIMFTHDTIGFSASSSSNMSNMVNVTNAFRGRLGMNAFANDKATLDYIKSMNNNNTSTGMTRLALANANGGTYNRFPDTKLTHKINESNITRYPYVLGDIEVSPTHLQYLRLDAEDPAINVAFTYKNGNVFNHKYRGATETTSPETLYHEYDGFNDYYTYSKGNLTFSGTGHSFINSVPEMQMFINTIYKASIGSNHAPVVQINGLTAGQNIPPSQDTLKFSFTASDVDWVDKNFDANIYVDRNNDGVADPGELVTYDPGDTATFKNITNGTIQNVELTKTQLALRDSVQQFRIILVVTDKRGAKGNQIVSLNHKNQPTLSVTSDVTGCLIGDSTDINFRYTPVATGISNEFKNIRMAADFTGVTSDIRVSDYPGWTQSGSRYSTVLPNLVFDTAATWSGDGTRSLNVTSIENSSRLAKSFMVSVPVTITYDRYDTVTKTTNSEFIATTVQIGIADGVLDIFANDNTGKGINNASVTINGPANVSGTTQSGAVRFNGLRAGKYTVGLTIPTGYMNAGTKLEKTINIDYGSYKGGSIPSVTFGVTQKVPEAPTNLTAKAGDAKVDLSWSAPSGADSNYKYNVKRSTTAGGPYTVIASNVQAASYSDTGLINGTTYYYVVSATNTIIDATGPDSNEANARPLAKPTAPTGVTAVAGDKSITLSWNSVPGVSKYKIYRGTTSEYYDTVISVENNTTFTDTNVTNGIKYYYAVTAVNDNGVESDKSIEVNAVPKPALAAPTGLHASYINGKVVLGWNAVESATSYIVRRSATSGGPYVDIASNISGTSFTDFNVVPGNIYFYVVCAINSKDKSLNSSELMVKTVAGNGEVSLPYGTLKFGVDTGIAVDDGTSSSNITFIPGQYIPFTFSLDVSSDGLIKDSQLVIKNHLKAINGNTREDRDFILEMKKNGNTIDQSKVVVKKNGTALSSQNYSVSYDSNGNIVINLGNGITLTKNDSLKITCIAKVSSSGSILTKGVKNYLAENGNNYLAAFNLNATQNNTNIPAGDYMIDIKIKENSIIQ